MESGKGQIKYAASKEHQMCDKERCTLTGQEISMLIDADQLMCNRHYLSSVIDVVEFLVVNRLK